MEKRVAACFDVAQRARHIVLATSRTKTTWKGRADPLSGADKASTKFIVADIKRRFPNDEIVCEDARKYPGSSGYTWFCDPLDGTLNAIRNSSPWGVSVALMRGAKILAGCVVEGKSGDVFTAVLGGGAQRNGKVINVSGQGMLRRSLVAFDCPYDMGPRNDTTYRALGKLLRVSGALRCYGSCAVALCLVAAGEIDVYAVEHGKPWDFAAGALITREAHGSVTTWSGTPYDPRRNLQVLASNSILHDKVVAAIRSFDAKEIYGPGARGKAGRLDPFWLHK
jgi:myo-inositol-1(or 4)-monophosphatase